MCVIVIQNKAVFPGWDNLKACWTSNPHGAGFMYQEDDKVRIVKGLMTFEDFKNAVSLVKNYSSRPMVYHFRISSHGTVNARNTHPYPFSPNEKAMVALDLIVPVGIAHNGVISRGAYSGFVQQSLNITDTAQFLRERYQVLKNNNYVKKSELIKELKDESKASSSRFVMMDGKEVRLFGTWYNHKGCVYSNNHSLPMYHQPVKKGYQWVNDCD